LSLELRVRVRDQGSQVGDGALVDDSLSELLSVLGDLAQSSGRDSLEGKLGLLYAENEQADGTGVNHCLGKLMGVLGDASKSPGGCLLHRGIELLQAIHKGVKRT
jgi:hypothetical protein